MRSLAFVLLLVPFHAAAGKRDKKDLIIKGSPPESPQEGAPTVASSTSPSTNSPSSLPSSPTIHPSAKEEFPPAFRAVDVPPTCGVNEQFTECASSTCFENTCAQVRNPALLNQRKCTRDCRRGCQCQPGYYRNYDGRCVDDVSCFMCGFGEAWVDCGRNIDGGCNQDEYDLTCEMVLHSDGKVLPITMSGCKCGQGFYRSLDGLCVYKEACERCGMNEMWETCGSSSCWELTCDDANSALEERGGLKACTLDCRQGCKCHPGFFRNVESGECVSAEICAALQ